jgi:hypothetical protein
VALVSSERPRSTMQGPRDTKLVSNQWMQAKANEPVVL